MSDEVKPLSEKQLGILERFGYDPNFIDDVEGKEIIDAIAENGWKSLSGGPEPKEDTGPRASKPGQATAKQKAVLRKYGYDDNVTFEQASAVIDELAANNWQRPEGLEV